MFHRANFSREIKVLSTFYTQYFAKNTKLALTDKLGSLHPGRVT